VTAGFRVNFTASARIISCMSDPKDPTADYRKYPKGPNFLFVVLAFCITILVVIVLAYFVLGWDVRKLLPHRPNPQPNAMVLSTARASVG
jgi:hypothetical protein